jgi:hypothetical protein
MLPGAEHTPNRQFAYLTAVQDAISALASRTIFPFGSQTRPVVSGTARAIAWRQRRVREIHHLRQLLLGGHALRLQRCRSRRMVDMIGDDLLALRRPCRTNPSPPVLSGKTSGPPSIPRSHDQHDASVFRGSRVAGRPLTPVSVEP